jgi:hypothetical protein
MRRPEEDAYPNTSDIDQLEKAMRATGAANADGSLLEKR